MILFIFNVYNEKVLSPWSIMYREYDNDVSNFNNCVMCYCIQYCIKKNKIQYEYYITVSRYRYI